MSFKSYLEKVRTDQSFTIDASWSQGRTTFGGLSAGLLLESIVNGLPADRPIRSFNVNFPAPLVVDVPVEIQVNTLANGKSMTQVMASALQKEKVCTVVIATLGVQKESTIVHPPVVEPVKNRDKGKSFGYIKDLTPEFIQYLEFIFCEGERPFSNNQSKKQAGWVKFKEKTEYLSASHIIALIDAWPPTVLQNYQRPGPSSTVSWNIDFVGNLFDYDFKDQEWIYYDSTILASEGGYAQIEAKIFGGTGELIAISRQLVTVYE